MAKPDEGHDLTNKSVVKAMTLLTQMGRYPAGVTLTELAQAARLSRPTAFRLLLSLSQTGFIEKADGKYRLGWKIARLGRLADPHGGIIARIQPVLESLAEELKEMVGYAVVNGEADFDLVAEAAASRLISLSQGYVGREFPLHASATGKIILAEMNDDAVRKLLPKKLPRLTEKTITDRTDLIAQLSDVRSRQFAELDDELEDSLYSIAIPVRSPSGRLIGVLSASGPTARMKARGPDAFRDPLRQTAELIARQMGEA